MADSHSVASSRASSASTKGRLAVAFFSQVIPIFPFFSAMQSHYPPSLVLLGCVVQAVQMLAFVLNPRLDHGESLEALSPIVYASHLPFWDPTFVKTVTFTQYLGPWVIALACVCLPVFSIFGFLFSGAPIEAEAKWFYGWRISIHAITSVLFVPLAQAFLSQMVCGGNGTLWSLTDQTCHSGTSKISMILSIIGFVILVVTTLLVQTCLFRQDPESSHPLARAHGDVDIIVVLWKALSCILFHVLLAQTKTQSWLPMYMLFSGVVMVAAYSFFLPYYHHSTNRFFVSSSLVVSMTGLVVYLCSGVNGAGTGFRYMDIDGLLFFACGITVWWVGQWIADWRVNAELIDTLPQLIDAAAPAGPRTHMIFPRGLPVYDLAYQQHRDLCSEIAEQLNGQEQSVNRDAFNGEDDEAILRSGANGEKLPAILCPYITVVHSETDVELATRFLRCSEILCPSFSKVQSIVLASRIFTKGLTRFRDSGVVIVSFAYMIASFAGKASLALQQAERVNRVETSFPVRYQTFKLQSRLKLELNLRDTTYQKIYDQAKKLHKETLIHMQQFWSKLLAAQVDMGQLTVLATLITHRRDEGNRTFLSALRYKNNDRMLLTKYAGFLEQVMLEPENAEQLRAITKQEMEERKKNAMRGARGGGAAGNHDQAVTDVLSQQLRATERSSSSSSSNRWMTFLSVLLLLGLCAGLIIFAFLTMKERRNAIRCVDEAGQVRTLVSQSGLYMAQLLYSASNSSSSSSIMTFNDSIPLLNALDASSRDMLSLINLLSIDEEKPTGSRFSFMKQPYVVTERWYSGSTLDVKPVTMWDMGYDVAQQIQSFAPTMDRYYATSASTSAIYNVTVTEVYAARSSVVSAFDTWIASAFNVSVDYCRVSFDEANTTASIVLSVLFAVSVCALVSVLGVVSLSVSRVSKFKQSVLSLFPLIPGDTLSKLATQAKERVDSYDEQDQEESNGLPQLQEPSAAPKESAPAASSPEAEHADDGAGQEEALKQRLLSSIDNRKDKNPIDMDDLLDQNTAVLMPDFAFTTLLGFLALLGATLAICVAQVALQRAPREAFSNAATRAATCDDVMDFINSASNATLHAFASGSSADRRAAGTAAAQLRSSLSHIISLRPSLDEVALLSVAATVEHDWEDAQAASLETFSRNPSSTFAQYINDVTPVATSATGDSARSSYLLPLNGARSAVEPFQLALGALTEGVYRSAMDAADAENLFAYNAVVVALCGAVVLFVVLIMRSVFATNGYIFFAGTGAHLLRGCMFLVVVVLALQAAGLSEHKKLHDSATALTTTLQRRNDTLDHYRTFSTLSRRFVLTGAVELYNRYFDWVALTGDEFGASDLLESDASAALKSTFLSAAQSQRSLELIAMRIMANATGPISVLGKEVQTLSWNFGLQSNAIALRAAFPNEPLRYTNTSSDLSQPDWLKVLRARFTIFSPNYDAQSDAAVGALTTFFSDRAASEWSDINSHRDNIDALAITSVVVSGIAFVLGAVYCIWTVGEYLVEVQQTNRRLREVHPGAQHLNGSQSGSFLKLGALVILGLIAATFAVGISSILSSSDAADNVDIGNTREWLVARSLLNGELLRANATDTTLAVAVLSQIENGMRVARETFYFGSSRDSYNIPGTDSTQDTLMFGTNVSLSTAFACGYEPSGTVSDASALVKGLSTLAQNYERLVQQLTDASASWSSVNATVVTMRAFMSPLLRGLRESNSVLLTSIEDRLTSDNTVFVILAAVSGGVVVLASLWLIIPLLQRQDTEERGSKLLLRLIPNEVCESVPAIQEFLEAEISGENRAASASGESGDNSTIPVIAIDARGVVLKFNTASESIFGYTAAEVIGNNVSILMPEKIAKNHDNYLANYRRTGNRRVIGFDRQVHAKRKSGELFPIELNVKEFKRDNGEFVYIGFAKDITKNLELRGTEELNNLIQEYATVPMIAIDSLGTVLRFNRAAEECFGQSVVDVVNQNIKMLMPEEIAARHDSYLAAYLRTREKHVIDATRRVQGLRKSGEVFPLEISVKEITTSDFGAMSTYLGFCRDLTQDNILDEANRINDEITDLSPVPIVGIDPYGKVLKFSKAACDAFGYEATEVLDRNVKMLMPESVAEQHDGYLEQYRQTGKKKIVGTEREVMVQRKDGTQIPMLALIREVKKEGTSMGTFVGYLVSLGEEKANAHFKAIDDVIVEMHPVPLVTMNAVGTITRVNKALLHEFGFRREEVIDKNIKMLMPSEVAMIHDSFLKRYADSRVAHIIGSSRRVHGRRKNNSVFPVEVKVDEVVDADGKSTFIGFLRNLTTDLAIEQQFQVNTTNLEISPTPMIGIDPYGNIKIFSKAAELCFKRSAASVLEKNVKLLMPQYIAEQHDMYLERYRKTGAKTVIDTTRIAEAVDAEGRTFPVELSVREVTRDGQELFYIAYVRDITRDGETQQIIYRNAQISDLSPLPLLQIDLYGIVQQFNSAAEQEFGWRREDVIGRNIKMIIPDEIAKNHDHYLAQYRKTRVKSVIGSLRRSRAKRKGGGTFAVELSVTEVIAENDPERNTYIGFIRDITEELRLSKANEVSGVISDLSPNPLVAITKSGSVITFNRAACIAFRYESASQVLGNNVKMLMPDDVAVRHDGFLIAYGKTGEKHVIDTTRAVHAKRNDGTVFPAEISVREIAKQGKESTFLSYIRDCTEDVAMAHATQVSEAIQSLSAVPMIIITVYGIIKRVNQATLPLLGYQVESQLVGKNIKMIMPESIAVHHDDYLATYLRTGQKGVIDTTREVVGLRADGSQFPAEVSVREVKSDDGETIYIGYLKDLTSAHQVAAARMVNEAIASSSVVPMIVMNIKGIVQAFVPAAEEFFGYTAAEVVGKNIKMLMPTEIAEKHDDYLATYAKTGVKHVVDSTRVATARLKSGDRKPVTITVKEIPSKTGDGVNFIGYVVDMSSQFAVSRAVRIADSVRDMMTISIISITEEGLIRQFNRAAEEFFGYHAQDVLGRNVKMLMPPDVARNHDGYLDTYHRTKVRHVIGSSRLVQGLHISGDLLDVELHVSEFTLDGKPNFIAYATDRRKELELSRSAMINEALVSLSLVPIVAIDTKNRISRFSASAEVQFGWTADEAVGQNVNILMPDNVAITHDAFLDRYRSKGHTYQSTVIDRKTELTAKRKDGSTFPAELTVKEIQKTGQLSSFVGYIRDITDDLVTRSNAILCESIESLLPDPILVINHTGIVQSFSPVACKLFGYAKDEVLGQNIKMLMAEDIATQHDGYLKRYMTTRVKHIVDTQRRVPGLRKDGTTVEIELRVKELQMTPENSYFIGYCRDTSRDYDLAIETEVGEALMELNPDAIITINPKGVILKFNAQAERLFQFDRKQIIGRNVKVLMPDAIAARHDMYLASYLKSGIKRIVDTTREVTAEKKTGELFQAEVSVREVKGEDGHVQYFLGYVRESQKK